MVTLALIESYFSSNDDLLLPPSQPLFRTILRTLTQNPALYLFIAFTSVIVYWRIRYHDRAVGTRHRPDIPMADGALPIVGHLLKMRSIRTMTHDFFLEQVKKHGDIVRLTLPGFGVTNPVDGLMVTNLEDVEYVYRDPFLFEKGEIMRKNARDLIGQGIFITDGDKWRQQRKTTAKVFNIGAFREYYSPIFEDTSMKVVKHLEACAKNGACVELQDLLGRATLESFGQTANGQVYGALKDEAVIKNGEYVLPVSDYAHAFDQINQVTARRTGNPFWTWTEWLDGTSKEVAKNVKVLRDFALSTIYTKRRLNEQKESHRKDLLDYFLEFRDEQGHGLSDDELVDHVRNFLTAGRDSTAQILCWLFRLLYHRPDIKEKMLEEICTVLGPNPGYVGYDKTKELKYVTAVFYEILRYWMILPLNPKVATQDCILPGTKTKVYKGQRIFLLPFVMGHLEKLWGPDVDEFKPERWLDEEGNVKEESQYKWPAFNAGPRICPGKGMGTHQILILISNIMRSVDLDLVREDEKEKYAIWNEDATKRVGRYDVQLSLALRHGIHFVPRIRQQKGI